MGENKCCLGCGLGLKVYVKEGVENRKWTSEQSRAGLVVPLKSVKTPDCRKAPAHVFVKD